MQNNNKLKYNYVIAKNILDKLITITDIKLCIVCILFGNIKKHELPNGGIMNVVEIESAKIVP